MRAHPILATASLAAVLACNHGGSSTPPGKADGEPCATASECRSGLCFRAPGAAAALCASSEPPAAGACPAPGTQTIVAGAAIDVPEPSACATPVRAPVTGAGFIDLGEHQVGEPLSFAVPANTTSFSIISQAVPGTTVPFVLFQGFPIPNSVVPTDIRDPTGALYYSDTDPLPRVGFYVDATSVLAYYGSLSPIAGAFTVPNTAKALDLALTAGELPAGTWTFKVNDFGLECATDPRIVALGCSRGSTTGRYHVQVVVETRPFTSTGALDVEVYLATDPAGRLPNAAAVVRDPQFARWVKSYSTYLAKGGICVGNVTVHDLPAWAITRYMPAGVLDVSGNGQGLPALPGCDDLSQLFTLALAQSQAVHLFFAEELGDNSLPGFTVLGVDGSIPGPSGVPGTVNGGAVIGLFDQFAVERSAGACSAASPDVALCGTDRLALVAAHETGHWLGLYHTTEADGVTFDSLSDTGTCPCVQCAPFALRARCAERNPSGTPTLMLSSYCTGQRPRCSGARNLMFWLFDPRFVVGETSRQQGDVVRRNPAVR